MGHVRTITAPESLTVEQPGRSASVTVPLRSPPPPAGYRLAEEIVLGVIVVILAAVVAIKWAAARREAPQRPLFAGSRAAPRLPPARIPNPRPRRRLLARPALHPDRRTRHRSEPAADRDRATAPAPRHPARPRRRRPVNDPTGRAPAHHPHRAPDHAATPDHRARARLSRPATGPSLQTHAYPPREPAKVLLTSRF